MLYHYIKCTYDHVTFYAHFSYSGGYTMDVVACTGFGLDIDAQSKLDHPFIKHAGTFFGVPKEQTWQCKLKRSLTMFLISKLIQTFLNQELFFL